MGNNLGKIAIRLEGAFCLMDPARRDLTPVSQKAQALIALLATSRDLKRTRSWLQDKLWSNSDASHGSASLRQTLSTVRKCLGDHADVVQANRLAIWLDPDRAKVIWNKDSQSLEDCFLEGMDIRDPEFNDWLQVMRNRNGPMGISETGRFPVVDAGPQRWQLALIAEQSSSDIPYQLESEFVDLVARNLSENGELDLIFQLPKEPGHSVFAVDVSAFPASHDSVGLRVTARHPHLNRVFWTETAISTGKSGSIDKNINLLGLAFRLQSAIAKEISVHSSERNTAPYPQNALSAAIPQIFSFRPSGLEHASQILSDVLDERNAATFLGWQAQIAVINLIERFTDAPEECVERGRMLAAKAVEADPMNSMVLSTAANARILLDWDIAGGSELAGLAVRVNPSNPLAWWAYANAALYAEDSGKSLGAAKVAARLASQSPLQFWCDFQVGLAALQSGDIELATRSLETSAALAPQFRPPRRYLLAIYAHQRHAANASRVMKQLEELEPGFDFETFCRDPDYPVSLARRANLFSNDTLSNLFNS